MDSLTSGATGGELTSSQSRNPKARSSSLSLIAGPSWPAVRRHSYNLLRTGVIPDRDQRTLCLLTREGLIRVRPLPLLTRLSNAPHNLLANDSSRGAAEPSVRLRRGFPGDSGSTADKSSGN